MGNVSVYGTQGVHILLEPNDNPAASAYQKALFEQGKSAASFFVEDIQKEYELVA